MNQGTQGHIIPASQHSQLVEHLVRLQNAIAEAGFAATATESLLRALGPEIPGDSRSGDVLLTGRPLHDWIADALAAAGLTSLCGCNAHLGHPESEICREALRGFIPGPETPLTNPLRVEP